MPADNPLEIVESLAVIAASLAAVAGIGAWRRDFIEKRKIELAEDALAGFLEARDVVRQIRSEWSSSSEGSTRKRSPSEDPAESEAMDRSFVLIERYHANREFFAKLQSLRYRFVAICGREAGSPFDDVAGVIRDLLGAATAKLRFSTRYATEHATEGMRKVLREADRIYYYVGDPEDAIDQRMNAAVDAIEQYCRRIINASEQ